VNARGGITKGKTGGGVCGLKKRARGKGVEISERKKKKEKRNQGEKWGKEAHRGGGGDWNGPPEGEKRRANVQDGSQERVTKARDKHQKSKDPIGRGGAAYANKMK